MSEVNIKLKGWHAAVALLVLAGLVVFRVVTFKDMTHDAKLMRNLETQIASDYLPKEAARLKAAMDSGDKSSIAEVSASVTGAKPKIESVQISAPLLNFSSTKDVVVKVVYSLAEGTETRDRQALYFLYRHGVIGNTWSYQYKTTAYRYLLNWK